MAFLTQCIDCKHIGFPCKHGKCCKCKSQAITFTLYIDPEKDPDRHVNLNIGVEDAKL